jgi:4-amino-4-deoxychorismate lyase
MQIALLDGRLVDAHQPALTLQNRGWQYGDGIFETMLLLRGRVRFWADHLERLQAGCFRLGMQAPTIDLLQHELLLLSGDRQDGVIKLTLMRSGSERGYRPPSSADVTRLWQLFDSPTTAPSSINVCWCDTRLSRNAQLAGLKHCNRLEQVLAQAEWRDADIAEGLMLDTEGELICGTMNNVFLVLDGVLVTPDLRYSGIAGVMRKNLLRLAVSLQIEVETRALRADDVQHASEVFMCNSVRGIQPVIRLGEQQWPVGELTRRLQLALQES